MSRIGVALCVVVCACGGGGGGSSARTSTPAGAPAASKAPPIEALCPAVARTIPAVVDATARGCFRQAGEALQAMPRGPEWSVVALELRHAALRMRAVGDAELRDAEDITDPFVHLVDDETQALLEVARAIARNEMTREVADDGRLLRLFVARFPRVPCITGREPDPRAVERFDAVGKKVMEALGGLLFGPKDRPRMVAGVAAMLLAKCDTRTGIQLREQAAEKLRRAGAFDEALELDFGTLELSTFFTQDAEHADVNPDERIPFLAYRTEERESGNLKNPSHAAVLEKTLENNAKAARTPAVAARIALERAGIALVHDGDYTAARKQARASLEQAIAAKRPDLADAARMVGATAAQLQDDVAGASRLFLDAFASARARGAHGVSHELVMMVQTLVETEQLRGRPQGDALAESLAAAIDHLPPMDVYMHARTTAEALQARGRIEDALALVDKAIPLVERAPAGELRTEVRAQLAHVRRRLVTYLDPHDSIDDIPADLRKGPIWEVMRAFADGDVRAVRAGLRAGHPGTALAGSIDHVCAMGADGVLASAREMLRRRDELKDMRTAQEGRMYGVLDTAAYALAICAATLHRTDFLRLANEIYAVDPIDPKRNPIGAIRRDTELRAFTAEASRDFAGAADCT
ncbi:MAG: hypothetical protein KIT31_12130 [Deltaproteobacteria bacterium]|nr:hypothetical protein [Deltaproteobacteria bacterium]